MSNELLRRPSPHPANPQQVPPIQGSQPQQIPMMGMRQIPTHEMASRITTLRAQMATQEHMLKQLQVRHNIVRGTADEGPLLAQVKELTMEYNKRKDYIQKLTQGIDAFRSQQSQANANGPAGSGQPSWIPHNTQQGQPFDPSAARSQMAMQNQQQSPSLQQAQANHLVSQGLVPPRSGPTPQLHPPGQQPQHTSPFNNLQVGGSSPFSFSANTPQPVTTGPSQNQLGPSTPQGAGVGNMSHPMPLDKTHFEATYKSFCLKRPVKMDPRGVLIENRPVDLHRLHVEVMKEGGHANVSQKDLWPVIGARLDFAQLHATDGEPARSGPGIGLQLGQIYQAMLQDFDNWYIAQMHESRKNAMSQGTARSPQQMQMLMTMSHLSVAELRARGVEEKMINFVEQHRPNLQRSYQEQRSFQNRLRNANLSQAGGGPHAQAAAIAMQQNGGGGGQQGQPQGQPRPVPPGIGGPGNSLPFTNSPVGQQQNATARNQFAVGVPQFVPQGPQQQQQQVPGGQAARMIQQQPGQQRIPLAAADALIQRCKLEYTTTNIQSLHAVDIPPEQRVEYNRLLENTFRTVQDTDQKLQVVVTVLQKEEVIRRLITIICTVQHQRSLLSTTSPRYVITFDNLRGMSVELQRIMDSFNHSFANMRGSNNQRLGLLNMQVPQPQQQQLMGSSMMSPPNTVMGTPDMAPQARPPSIHQPPNVGPPQQQNLRPSVSLQPPPKRGAKASQGAGAVSTPSPAPMHSASTPITNAPTPTAMASSPPSTVAAAAATKSPKTKAPPKPKLPQRARRVSKAATPVAPPAPPPAPEQTQPTTSTSGNGGGSAKRPREEEFMIPGPSSALNEASPPKRAKLDWESEPSEALRKKKEDMENFNSDQDPSTFLAEMTELIKRATAGEGSGLSETLEMILKGYGTVPNLTDGAGNVSLGESSNSARESTPPPGSMAELDEYFDFSFGTVEDEDNNSKAPTPDLVSSSSTNPSPESNHELEAPHHTLSSSSSSTVDVKTEELSNPPRLGIWKDVDGGEAAYYQPNEWKWDSPMASFDPAWAIFNS